MQVSAHNSCARYAFQAGHEGSIPFARSNGKSQVSALDLPCMADAILASARYLAVFIASDRPARGRRVNGCTVLNGRGGWVPRQRAVQDRFAWIQAVQSSHRAVVVGRRGRVARTWVARRSSRPNRI